MRDVLAGLRRRYATRHTSWISLCQIWRVFSVLRICERDVEIIKQPLESTVCFCMFMGCMHESCMHGMLVSPARRRSGLDSTRRDGATVEVLRLPPLTLFAPEDNQS